MNLLERVTRAVCQRRYPLTDEIACCGKCGTMEEMAQAAIFAVAHNMSLAGADEDPSGQQRMPMKPHPLDDEVPFPRAVAKPVTSEPVHGRQDCRPNSELDSRDGGQISILHDDGEALCEDCLMEWMTNYAGE